MSVAVKLAKSGNGNGSRAKPQTFNISQLAFRFDLDRATCRKRIKEAGIEPVEEKAKEKLYEMTDRLAAVLDQTDAKLADAKRRMTEADARLKEMRVMEAEGELIETEEVADIVTRLFGGQYKEHIRMIRRWAARVTKLKTPAEAEKLMVADYQRSAERLKKDFESFLEKARGK